MPSSPENSSKSPESSREKQGQQTESIEALQSKIASADRAIKLAAKLNDPGRVQQMEATKKGFETSLAGLQPKQVAEAPAKAPLRDWEKMVAALDENAFNKAPEVAKIDNRSREDRFNVGRKAA